jgi:predicted nucleotidyltransferase
MTNAGGKLEDEALRTLARALDRPGVVAASVFGSNATGRAHARSDVDLAIWLDPALAPDERLALRIELTDAAAAALPATDADVTILNDAPPLLVQRARQARVPLVDRDPRQRIRLESRALIEYLDTIPLREELERGVRNRLREGSFGR